MSNKCQYVTTAIDYPNAAPHMGHVLEKVLADVVVRWMRLRGDEVRFQIGTDEHGIKIQQTAKKEGVTPKELVDRNAPIFQDLYDRLGVSYDIFLRTSDQKVHWPTVTELWKRLKEAGMLEKRSYEGLYCSGCERFVTEKDLVDGKCPDHGIPPQKVREENWFFTLSSVQDRLEALLKGHWNGQKYRIEPQFRETETLMLLKQGLEDVSFSRPVTSLSWGVPVPGEKDQTMYVWCDALTNYISGLGFFTDHEEAVWWNDAQVTHVIGKDIARFHALIWPAMLTSAGVRAPDRLLIHGFLTSEGQKMSKSIGNVVVPDDVIAKYGVDALRFYLSHEIPVGNDGDFSWKRFGELYDSKLRNQLGNLLNRVLVLISRDKASFHMNVPAMDIQSDVKKTWESVTKSMNAFDVHGAIGSIMGLVDACNLMMQTRQPWTLKGDEKNDVLSGFAEVLRHIDLMLLPFLPQTSLTMAKQLAVPYAESMLSKSFVIGLSMKAWGGQKDWMTVGEPAILFAPVEQ